MRGESEGELKLEAGKLTMVHVPLYRLVAKVNFTVDNLCTAGYPNLTLTGITLRNVPAVGSYARLTEATHREVRYPAVARANFKDYDAQTEGLGAGCQLLWYLTPNSRGVGSGTTSLEKTMLSAPEGQGGCCTYVYVQGQIRTAADATPIPVGYRVYLGGNSTNDYNVWANESYNVRLTIRKLPSNPAADIGRDGFTVDMAAVEGFDHTVDWVRPMSVGDLYGAGVVYWVNPDDANDFRIVAMDEVSALHWASSTGYVLGSGAQNSSARNGAEVWRLAKAYSDAKTGGATGDFATDFPAFAACYDKTEGGVPKGTWYLPSLQETTDLNAVKAAVGEVIATYGGMALAEGERWTATESSSNKSQGSRYNFSGSGNSGSGNKNTDGIVRCVRGPR